jgi:hypothetical protein
MCLNAKLNMPPSGNLSGIQYLTLTVSDQGPKCRNASTQGYLY